VRKPNNKFILHPYIVQRGKHAIEPKSYQSYSADRESR